MTSSRGAGPDEISIVCLRCGDSRTVPLDEFGHLTAGECSCGDVSWMLESDALADPEALLDCMRRRWDRLPPTAILAALGWSDPDRRDAALMRLAARIAMTVPASKRRELFDLN